MRSHSIDALSAALGISAIAFGLIVALGRADSLVADPGWVLALIALLAGVSLVPWGGSRRSEPTMPLDPFAESTAADDDA